METQTQRDGLLVIQMDVATTMVCLKEIPKARNSGFQMASRTAGMKDFLTASSLVVMKAHYWVGRTGFVMEACLVEMRAVCLVGTKAEYWAVSSAGNWAAKKAHY